MNRSLAWFTVAGAVAISAVSIAGPVWAVLGLLIWSMVFLRRNHWAMLIFIATSLIINTALLAWLTGPATMTWAGIGLSERGAILGIVGALRISALVIANLALLQHIHLASFLDNLGLGKRATGFLAAILIASRDVEGDMQRLREAALLDGTWPTSKIARLRLAASWLPPLLLLSLRRAEARREALRGAGVGVGQWFAPMIAVTTLAMAGRVAFVAVPNFALTYVIVFAGGLVFGPRVGFWAGFWAMAITDLMFTGFAPASYVNAPAMGVLGLLGAAMRLVTGSPATMRVLAAGVGIFGTMAFSIISDVASWALIPEFRTSIAQLQVRVFAGLVFNAVPALTNGLLFGLAAAPLAQAAHSWRPSQA